MCYNKDMEEKIVIEYYETDNDKCPYLDWEADLSKDLRAEIGRG